MGDFGKGFPFGDIEKKSMEQVGYSQTTGYPHEHIVAKNETVEY